MDNKKVFFAAVILVIIAILSLGGYYFYQQYWRNKPVDQPEGFSFLPIGEETDNKCGQLYNIIIDGTFEKIEDGQLYLQPKETSEQINIVNLTDETEFFKTNLSKEMQVLDQTETTLDEFKEGDNISVVAMCDSQNPDEKTVLIVRKIVVEPENNPAESEG